MIEHLADGVPLERAADRVGVTVVVAARMAQRRRHRLADAVSIRRLTVEARELLIRQAAQEYAERALTQLVALSADPDATPAQVRAAQAILDAALPRGGGASSGGVTIQQAIGGEVTRRLPVEPALAQDDASDAGGAWVQVK